jgi:hypothetical protein
MLQNLAAEAHEWFTGAITWSREVDINLPIDSPGRRSHNEDAMAHVDRFIDVVGDEQHCCAPIFPEAQNFVLHAHSREGVERAERFIEQENFGMIDECACKRNTLGHATGKMVRICTSKRFESDQPHEFVHFISFFAQDTPRGEAGLDIPADSQPREQIRILKNETALRVRFDNFFVADNQLPRIRNIQAGDESKQRRLSTTTRSDQRNQVASGNGKRYAAKGESTCARRVRDRKTLTDFVNANA